MNEIISLRNYIDNKDKIKTSAKTETFCRLMKHVSESIEKEERNLIRINLDEIKINIKTNEIVFPEHLFSDEMDKTIANFNTGISLIADRKSTNEHKKVAFALMILGWYVTPTKESIRSDIEVLENFDYYMSKVPEWLRDFFINTFKKMDYTTSFDEYYNKNFVKKSKNYIREVLSSYNLNKEQVEKIVSLILKETLKVTKEGEENE